MLGKKVEEKLFEITSEEIAILEKQEIDFSLYTSQMGNIVDIDNFLNKNDLITIRKHTRFIEFPEHSHNYVEVQYVYSGSITQYCDGKEVKLKSGQILFLNQNVTHRVLKAGKDDIVINFLIKPAFFNDILSLTKSDNNLLKFLMGTIYTHEVRSEYLHFKVSEIREIQQAMSEIIIELYEPSQNTEIHDILMKLNVAKLFTLLIKHIDKLEVSSEDAFEAQLMFQIINYIDSDFSTGSLKDLSAIINIPDYKISKMIKKNTGKNFVTLIQDKRLAYAEELLLNSKLTIDEIAYEVGYENLTYFYKLFKNKYGMTPLKLRKEMENQHEN